MKSFTPFSDVFKNKQTILALSAVGLLVAFGAARAIEAATELARVNGQVISLEDFNKQYQDGLKYFQGRAPSRKAMLEDMIKRDLGIQEARKMGLDKDPVVIDRMNTVLFQALVEKKLAKDFDEINVTDSDARDYYASNPELRTSHIFVAVPMGANASMDKAAQEKIQKIYNDHVRAGKESFAEVAQHFSEGPNAQNGGDLDYQTKDRMDPAYYQAAVALKTPGKISGIVRSQFGYHIIKLTAIRRWDETDRGLVKRMLVEQRRAQAFDKYMAALRSHSKVAVHSELLKD
jgi:parvulin-like peptidyl-prolyl isomerase